MTAAICPTCAAAQSGRPFCCPTAALAEVEALRREVARKDERIRQLEDENEILEALRSEVVQRLEDEGVLL